jgi:hypothetical protein
VEDLCQILCRLAHKELQIQDLDTVAYKDVHSIRRNIHKARRSQLLPHLTNAGQTHEALSTVQVLKTLKEQFWLVNDSQKL